MPCQGRLRSEREVGCNEARHRGCVCAAAGVLRPGGEKGVWHS